MHKELFDKLVEIVAVLRSENGCPWDRAQTHETLKPDLIEEAYETIEAIDAKEPAKLKEELGDLLVNVMLHSQIAAEAGTFNISDVIQTINDKLIRRHPHVFGDVEVADADEVLSNWETIKRQEAGYEERTSALDGIPARLPSLHRAQKIQRRAARVGFDWDDISDVLPKLDEELAEIKESITDGDPEAIEMEVGDLLFAVVNLCRFLNVRAEEALRKSNEKFISRFKDMEAELERRGAKFEDYDLNGLDEIWDEAKRLEKVG
jgi:tetrapyrrole methylase family protein / MazG family protein